MLAVVVSANAQFHGTATYTHDMLNGSPVTLAASGTTNILALAYIGKDGFSVTPNFTATASTNSSNVAIQATPAPDGAVRNNVAVGIGNVAANGVTPVRSSIFVAGTTFYGTGQVQITLINSNTSPIVVSNVFVGSW